MAATARIVESVGVSAYLGGAALVSDPVLLTSAASILTVEARHQTVLNIFSSIGTATTNAFDFSLTPSDYFKRKRLNASRTVFGVQTGGCKCCHQPFQNP